jgi:hypothetical protein
MGSRKGALPLRTECAYVVLFASVLACACSRREPPPPPPPPPPSDVDRELLESAMRQCFTVDCDLAHARASQISSDSPLRQTDDFHAIEFRFEVNELLRAEREIDFGKKRAMLERLRNSPEVDVGLRAAAGERLARLGNGSAAFELALVISPDGGADAGVDAGSAEATLLASLMRSKKPEDYQKVRDLLEPKIYSGRATPDDVRMMTTVCKAEKDTACLKMLKTLVLH